MILAAAIFVLVSTAVVVLGGYLITAGVRRLGSAWLAVGERSAGGQLALAALSTSILAAPWLVDRAIHAVWTQRRLAQRLSVVPASLRGEAVEYEAHDNLDHFGLPGDNEGGFFIVRLTPASIRLARSAGRGLLKLIEHPGRRWAETPIDAVSSDLWHLRDRAWKRPPHQIGVAEYAVAYTAVTIDPRRAAFADRSIRNPGSFYAYDAGGELTVVDPTQGRVFVVYAG